MSYGIKTLMIYLVKMDTQTINGIDNKRLFDVVNEVKKNPDLARFQFRLKNTWMNGGHSRSVVKGFYGAEGEDRTRNEPFIFENDQPLILLGTDRGASPLEYFLNALAGCITDSIIYSATINGIKINELESELEGNFDFRNFFMQNKKEHNDDNIKVKIMIKGNNLGEEEKIFLCNLGKKSSPVYRIITNSYPVNISIENDLYLD